MWFKKDSLAIGEQLAPYRACFSKPKWGHFQTYINGLILGDDGDKNVMDIAGFALDGKSQSSLNRFLHRSGPAVRAADRLRLKMSMSGRKGGCLIIDDTLIEKTGKHMEGAGFMFDHCQNRNVWSHNFVNCVWSDGTRTVPLTFRTYLKDDVARKMNRPFRTKVELAIQLIEEAKCWSEPEFVLFDAWFGANELLESVQAMKLRFICEAKSNRLIMFQGQLLQVAKVFPMLNANAFRRIDNYYLDGYDRCCEIITELKTGLKVKVVFITDGKHFRTLISDALEMSAEDIVEKYKVRWNIEVFYRDCKQHLGMGEYQVRGIDVGVIHLLLVFLAYTILKGVAGMSKFKRMFDGGTAIGTICQTLKRLALQRLICNARWAG